MFSDHRFHLKKIAILLSFNSSSIILILLTSSKKNLCKSKSHNKENLEKNLKEKVINRVFHLNLKKIHFFGLRIENNFMRKIYYFMLLSEK